MTQAEIEAAWKQLVVTAQEVELRPASVPGTCIYCRAHIGQPHNHGCVMVVRKVKVRYTFTVEESIPYHWTGETFEFCRNLSSSCANRILTTLVEYAKNLEANDDCLCRRVKAEFVGEISEEPLRRNE